MHLPSRWYSQVFSADNLTFTRPYLLWKSGIWHVFQLFFAILIRRYHIKLLFMFLRHFNVLYLQCRYYRDFLCQLWSHFLAPQYQVYNYYITYSLEFVTHFDTNFCDFAKQHAGVKNFYMEESKHEIVYVCVVVAFWIRPRRVAKHNCKQLICLIIETFESEYDYTFDSLLQNVVSIYQTGISICSKPYKIHYIKSILCFQ